MVVSSDGAAVGVWRQLGRVVMVTAATVVAVPYTLAVLANTLYGWPQGPNRYRRALHPRKVYSMNYAILQQLDNLRYARLFFTWRRFYAEAPRKRLIKDIEYGKNNNTLDVYLPQGARARGVRVGADGGGGASRPVVVFVYGGSWGSGDKNMYGLLATQIADMLQAVVVCPNYSLYPVGYVDDMVQDVVDTLTWIQHSAHLYNADKERVLLLGHSAGGHLVAMATLELVMKRLLTNPESLINSRRMSEDVTGQSFTRTDSIQFEDSHFNGTQDISIASTLGDSTIDESKLNLDESISMSVSMGQESMNIGQESMSMGQESLIMGQESDDKSPERQTPSINLQESMTQNPELLHTEGGPDTASTTGSFYFVDPKSQSFTGELPTGGDGERAAVSQIEKEELKEAVKIKESEGGELEAADNAPQVPQQVPQVPQVPKPAVEITIPVDDEATEEDRTARRLDLSSLETSELLHDESGQAEMTMSQREVRDTLSSIKAVIGLAGVYHIGDHYAHEAWRGVEDISSMGKAMYGPEFFDRFSPSHIVPNLPANTQFPPVHLIHGDLDTTVPASSSSKFGKALHDLGCRSTLVTVLPGCGHKEICLDLMDPSRAWYDPVMAAILQTAQRYL